LESGQFTGGQLTSGPLRYAPTATMTIPRTHARLMATTVLTISSGARLSARDPGSMVTMAAADSTGVARLFTVAGQPSMDAAESDLMADSAAALQFAAAVDSIVSPQHAADPASTVELDFAEAAVPAVGAEGNS
jgi:hypothetical protein